jgi:AraC-like DNA-binding protein
MKPDSELDRLLVTLDVDVQTLAFCELRRGRRLVAPPIDAIMMHYVLAGRMHVSVPGSDPIICGPGSVVLIPPRMHLHVSTDDNPTSDVIATSHCSVTRDGMLFCDAAEGGTGDLRYVSGIVLASFSGSFGLFDKLVKPIFHDIGNVELVRQAYTVMLDELESPSLGARALTSALMKACLVIVLREFLKSASPESSWLAALSNPRLNAAVQQVLDQPQQAHSVTSLAACVGMSRSAFARHFTDTFGMSPMAFVGKTRLFHGAQLLRSTPLPVKVIAAASGFASRSHFSRAFKASYGMDPTTFREEAGAGAIDSPPMLGDVSEKPDGSKRSSKKR